MDIYDKITYIYFIFYNLIEQLVVADLAGGVDWVNSTVIIPGYLVVPHWLSVSRHALPV